MNANQYVPIRVSTLRGDLSIPFDAYVKIGPKHILFCREGDSFEGGRLARLKEKKLKKMFILQDQENAYRKYISDSIDAAYDNSSGKSIEVRAAVVQGAQQAASEEVMENPDDAHAYAVAKSGSKKYVDFILGNNNSIKSILAIENNDQDLAHHGVTVATLAIGIAKHMGYVEEHPELLDQLALGALLHDFEHFHTPIPYMLNPQDMSDEDREIYYKHPLNGADRVKHLSHFDELVIKIIQQHEEYINGTGFPYGLKEKDIDPLVSAVSTANSFDRYVSFFKIDPKDALKKMLIEKMGLHPLDQMKALQNTLKNEGIL